MLLPTLSNFDEALFPSRVIAAMQTTAINATSSAYSTSEAPRSSFTRVRSQAATYSYAVIILVKLPSLTGFELLWHPSDPSAQNLSQTAHVSGHRTSQSGVDDLVRPSP